MAVALALSVAACSGGPKSPTVAALGAQPATNAASQPIATVAPAGAPRSAGATPLAEALAYSQCMRSHGVLNFPDPVLTSSGGYGYRTTGIDPHSVAFQGALQACKALPSPWQSSGRQLSSAQQAAWLSWAMCIRAHGLPNFADPTFPGGGAVQIAGAGGSGSPQMQSAMGACKSQMPSTGGLGG